MGFDAGKRAVSISPSRLRHILDGDATGGGHLWPGASGKTPFPREWTAAHRRRSLVEAAADFIEDLATDPTSIVEAGRGGRLLVTGTRDGITVRVVVNAGGEILTAFPIGLPRNPARPRSRE